ncbi:MAG: hypothetical protein H6Q55_825 [Deltaproteobacteria bacterium]|jgi:hypothetical protein|nr:hypothetical protein [Deltaproteobacteria bacterium]
MNVDWFFKNLSKTVSDEANSFFETIVYLDTEQLSGTYSGLTGLRERPRVEVQSVGGEYRSAIFSPTGNGPAAWQTYEISDSQLLRAMLPGLRMAYPRITDPVMLKSAQKQRVWIEGALRNALYVLPRGLRCEGRTTALVLEFIHNDIKATMTLLNQYMSSIYRPFVTEERMFEEKAELFGYLHSCEEKKIAISPVKEKIAFHAVITPIAILRK